MSRYAIVKDGTVTNLVEWDGFSDYPVDGDLIVANSDAYIGGEYEDGAFVAYVPTAAEIAAQEVAEAEAAEAQAAKDAGYAKLEALGLNAAEIAAVTGQ
jgi:hypothetical protein